MANNHVQRKNGSSDVYYSRDRTEIDLGKEFETIIYRSNYIYSKNGVNQFARITNEYEKAKIGRRNSSSLNVPNVNRNKS